MIFNKTIKKIKYHFSCGIHSNIPMCCILWWLLVYIWLSNKVKGKLITRYIKIFNDIQYIPCPICCLLKKKYTIKICECRYKTLI